MISPLRWTATVSLLYLWLYGRRRQPPLDRVTRRKSSVRQNIQDRPRRRCHRIDNRGCDENEQLGLGGIPARRAEECAENRNVHQYWDTRPGALAVLTEQTRDDK